MTQPITLASGSPRRRQLLEMLGLAVLVTPPNVQELRLPGEAPEAYARRLARDKVRAVPGACVLGADTIVVVEDQVLEKPVDEDDAVAMLQRLQGRRHDVVTAVALLCEGTLHEGLDRSGVWFRPADEALLRQYVRTGESMDKAGAYAIQGYGAALVERIEGDFFGVMGLPLRVVLDLLARAGRPYRFGP